MAGSCMATQHTHTHTHTHTIPFTSHCVARRTLQYGQQTSSKSMCAPNHPNTSAMHIPSIPLVCDTKPRAGEVVCQTRFSRLAQPRRDWNLLQLSHLECLCIVTQAPGRQGYAVPGGRRLGVRSPHERCPLVRPAMHDVGAESRTSTYI